MPKTIWILHKQNIDLQTKQTKQTTKTKETRETRVTRETRQTRQTKQTKHTKQQPGIRFSFFIRFTNVWWAQFQTSTQIHYEKDPIH